MDEEIRKSTIKNLPSTLGCLTGATVSDTKWPSMSSIIARAACVGMSQECWSWWRESQLGTNNDCWEDLVIQWWWWWWWWCWWWWWWWWWWDFLDPGVKSPNAILWIARSEGQIGFIGVSQGFSWMSMDMTWSGCVAIFKLWTYKNHHDHVSWQSWRYIEDHIYIYFFSEFLNKSVEFVGLFFFTSASKGCEQEMSSAHKCM